MRFLWSWGGICLCLLVWICALSAKEVTKALLFDTLFVVMDEAGTATDFIDGRYTVAGLVLKGVYDLAVFLGLSSHIAAMLADPGSTRNAPIEPPTSFTGTKAHCRKCKHRWKPPRAHHCQVCRECIFKMDHHCPWINNCIGHMNQKYFFLFLVYMGLACFLNLIIIITGVCKYLLLLSARRHMVAEYLTSKCSLLVVMMLIGSCAAVNVFFLVLTMDFLSEQVEALETNTTLVETYKNTHGKQTTLWGHASAVFGSAWWLWWLPVPPDIKCDWTEPEFRNESLTYSTTNEVFSSDTRETEPGMEVQRRN